ncbi:MAG: hypothetical protein U9Q27_01195 [Patescibacteria group bacterium]|nr:hypothetical protein [Patescibacteria group bacterium]
MIPKFLKFVKIYQQDIALIIGVILISLLSFALGYITAYEQHNLKQPIQIEKFE